MVGQHDFDIVLKNAESVRWALGFGKTVVKNALRKGMLEGGAMMNKRIRDKCPEDTGLLKACIGKFDGSLFHGPVNLMMGSTGGSSLPKRFPRKASMARPKASWAVFKYNPADFSLLIGTKVPYAEWIENGVNVPGPIYPKRAKYLRFVIDGEVYFRRSVRGHSIPPSYFFRQGVKESKAQFQRILEKRVNQALRSLAAGKAFRSLLP